MSKPVIGISTCFEKQGHHNYHQTADKYVAAVLNTVDGLPLLIPALGDKLHREKLLETVDGLLLTGSYSNIEPHHYSEGTSVENSKYDPNRDATTLPLIPGAIDAGIPIFAVCRGFQEMNVAFGGSLHQNVHRVSGMLDHREDSSLDVEEQYEFAHPIIITKNGVLDKLTGEKEPMVNSLHWQGIDQLGKGLNLEALAPDGLIEAFSVDDAKTFALAVQWHPEWKVMETPFYQTIFETFGAACINHTQIKNG
ncbi:MAG TPA: gamma-glutamyl-gamma-aminobutyrate hydrolase family protein [Candidatus Marinimicrobia bacterium]|nr:gamma-glutamyl-gamma-aminobutyrate hydrolase family protein [Candidatus Neomarinimicrobiota bacterium]